MWILVHLEELQEFPVILAFLDMKGERHVVERVDAKGFIVDLHVVPNSLLVAQVEVVLLMVGGDHVMRGMVLLFLVGIVVLVLASETKLAGGLLST